MQTFKLKIVSPTRVHFDGEAGFCGIITDDGSMGFEARHEPVLAVLKVGSEVRYRDSVGQETSLMVTGGMLSFKENGCTIILETAAPDQTMRNGSR